MSKPTALIAIAASLSLLATGPALSQSVSVPVPGDQTPTTGERVTPSRLGRPSQERDQQRRRPAAPTPPTPEEIRAAAQLVATSANSACQVTEATLLGVTAEQLPMYEAACATGPGYILVSTTPPQAVDCVILAGQADLDRSRDPAADVGVQCKLPANTDVVKVISAYAREAGITCTVDQGGSIGKSTAGNLIYEVGCAEADGFWLEKTPTGWETTTCMQVITQSAACKFTQPAEQAATLKTMLAGSPAAACNVVEARYMGSNTNGAFYEAKCGADEGYIVRFNTEKVVQQVYPCAEAARIGGGCKLITVAAAPEAAAPAPAAN